MTARRSIRDYLTPDQRALPVEATIDPGFVNRRRIQTYVGLEGMRVVDDFIQRLPTLPEWMREVRIDHIYKDVFLEFCRVNNVPTLLDVLSAEQGRLISSTVRAAPCRNFYDVERAVTRCVPAGGSRYRVELRYSTNQVRADTLKSRLHQGTARLAVVAELHEVSGVRLIFDPLLMGFPWLRISDPEWQDRVMWWSRDFFEHFVEDFDEFSKVTKISRPRDVSPMKKVSERGFKWALGEILGDETVKDWRGETSDHFTSLHLRGKRVTAAFLLKGPARFAPMGLNHLGKNNDQILRLAREPAEVLFVQHCHAILPTVRETLRTFAVRPYGARRYCLIDGRDSLRILKAYDLYDDAVKQGNRK